MLSEFQAVVNNRSGVARIEISTDPGMGSILGSDELPFNANQYGPSFGVATDWGAPIPQLQTGVTYFWRGIVDPTGAELPVVGPVQSFQLKPGGGVVSNSATGTSSGGIGTGSGGVSGGTITPVPQPQPPAPPAPPPPPPPPPPPAPASTSVVATTAKASKGIKVTLACSGPCSAKASATVSKKIAKKLGVKSTTIGTAKASVAATGSKILHHHAVEGDPSPDRQARQDRRQRQGRDDGGGRVSTTATKVTVKG
jgi:hypothetical protein